MIPHYMDSISGRLSQFVLSHFYPCCDEVGAHRGLRGVPCNSRHQGEGTLEGNSLSLLKSELTLWHFSSGLVLLSNPFRISVEAETGRDQPRGFVDMASRMRRASGPASTPSAPLRDMTMSISRAGQSVFPSARAGGLT